METIGYRISKARRYMNMNQKELALKANIPEGSLSRYENDIREPKAQALVQIADALKVSTDYLLGLTDEMEIQNNSLADKSDEEFEAIYEAAKEKFTTGTVMFDGEPATQEAIDSMLQAMRMGMLLALEEQKKKRNNKTSKKRRKGKTKKAKTTDNRKTSKTNKESKKSINKCITHNTYYNSNNSVLAITNI